MEEEVKKLASDMRKDMEDVIHGAKYSVDSMKNVRGKFKKFVDEAK